MIIYIVFIGYDDDDFGEPEFYNVYSSLEKCFIAMNCHEAIKNKWGYGEVLMDVLDDGISENGLSSAPFQDIGKWIVRDYRADPIRIS